MTADDEKIDSDNEKQYTSPTLKTFKGWVRALELVALNTLDSNNWKVSSQGFGGEKRFDWGPDIMTSEEELYESRNDNKLWKGQSIWWQHLLAGGVAGTVAQTCTAPLDTIILFMQAYGSSSGGKSLTRRLSSKNAPQEAAFPALQRVVKEVGIPGMWRYNGVMVLSKGPQLAIKFAMYDKLKRWMQAMGGTSNSLFHERFVAGALAGAVAQSFVYPIEVVKTRLTLSARTSSQNAPRAFGQCTLTGGIWDCAQKLYKYQGLSAFYSGYIANLIGIIPYAGINLALYETLKDAYLLHLLEKKKKSQRQQIKNANQTGIVTDDYQLDVKRPPTLVLLSIGTFSSTCGQIMVYPLALVRTKLQAQAGMINRGLRVPSDQTHATGLLKYILRTEGVLGLYRGITLNFCRVAPNVAIYYVVYEQMQDLLDVKMA